MEAYGPNLSPYGEAAMLSKTPQTPGKKKIKKKRKKKKKKTGTQDDAEKQLSKGKKQPEFLSSLELYSSLRTEDDAAKEEAGRQPEFLSSVELHSSMRTEDDATKEEAGRMTRQLFASASNVSLLTEGHLDESNESLRWNGILEDPVAEEERLWHYRLNRRKRYDAYIHQSLPPEPSLTLKHLPGLFKMAHRNGDHWFCKTELSSASSQNSQT